MITTYMCPSKDIGCGTTPALWCAGCPLRTTAAPAAAAPERWRSGVAAPVAIPEARRTAPQAAKYDDVLLPFLSLMRKELHANAGKGDRPGWLSMNAKTALLEVYYHLAKLQKAVRNDDGPAIQEHSADVANMAMMVLDICGGLAWVDAAPAPQPPAAAAPAEDAHGSSWWDRTQIQQASKSPLLRLADQQAPRREKLDAIRWQTLCANFGNEVDMSSPGKQHDILIRMRADGCEVLNSDGSLNFAATLAAIMDDEARIHAMADQQATGSPE